MSPPDKYGKRRQITFRIGPIAEDRLRQVAALFNLKPSEYAKAVLYRDLGVFNEPLDQRKHSWRKKKQQKEKEEELETFRGLGKKHKATVMETDAETDMDSEFDFDFKPGRGTTRED